MRLWHEDLIPALPSQQLLGQHRECCALRGNGWGRKHSVVNYVFLHSPYRLFQYHTLVMEEMSRRGYRVSEEWRDKNYRGKQCLPYTDLTAEESQHPVYAEHTGTYLDECVSNLRQKLGADWEPKALQHPS